MTEITPPQRRFKGRFFVFFIIVSLGLGIFFAVRSCTSDISPIMANILLEKGGEKYLFSALTENIVQQKLENGELPAVFNNLLVYKDGDDVFVQPSSMQSLVAIAAGEYALHSHKEPTINDYVTTAPSKSFELQTSFKATSELGRQDIVNKVVLMNAKGEKMTIQWIQNAKEFDYYGLKNCEVHSFWTETRPSPGEVVVSTSEYLVVPVQTLADFLGCGINFDEESKLLRVKL